MRFKTAVLFALTLGTTAAVAQPLSLREALDAALASEPTLAAARAELEIAAASRREAAAAREPQAILSASAVRHDEPMVVGPIHGFTPGLIPEFDRTLVQSSIQASWLLWDGGGVRARVGQAAALEESAAVGVEAARERVVQRTAAAYLGAVTARDLLAAHDQRLDALDAELARVRLLREVGRAADVESLRVEAARAAAEAERTEAASLLEVALGELARLTSLPPERTAAEALIGIVPATGAYEAEALESSALEANAVVRQAGRLLESQRAALQAARAARRPQVQLAGALLEYGSGAGDFTFEWNAGVLLRMPLRDRSIEERIARATAAVDLARARVEVVEDGVRAELDRALADWRRAVAGVESLERAARSFAEVVRIERLRLDTGVGTQSDYLDAEADFLGAQAALAAARQRLALARVELARLTGQLDPARVETIFQE